MFLLLTAISIDREWPKVSRSGEGLFAKINRHQGACFWAKPWEEKLPNLHSTLSFRGNACCRYERLRNNGGKEENGTGRGIGNDIKEEDL